MNDFCKHVLDSLDLIIGNGHLPIIVGGSNSYLKKLVEDPSIAFFSKYDSCFIWIDVSLPTLFQYVGKRVDEMVEAGMVDEIRQYFVPGQTTQRELEGLLGFLSLILFLR